MTNFDALFMAQYEKYPLLTCQDCVKALYQSIFGCGHFVGEAGRKYLDDELATVTPGNDEALIEPIGEDYCRVHISKIHEAGLDPDTLFGLFRISSEEPAGDCELFNAGLARLEDLIAEGTLPLDREESAAFLEAYRAAGCPAAHHSDKFRAAYSPAYRVVCARYCHALPLICRIDRELKTRDVLNVAIEGGSASGKSSLGKLLSRLYDCNLFHMDDFFLQPHQRTPERFAQPGGNVDYERFHAEVAEKLSRNEPFEYQIFDCSVMALGEKVQVTPKKLNIIEGAYSMHPELRDTYHISAFLDSDPEVQKVRILRRNGEVMLKRFVNEWIPLEHVYFEKTGVREACDIILPAPAK